MKNLLFFNIGFLILISSSGFYSCKTTQPGRPAEQYEELFEQGISVVNIPLQFSVSQLERMLNKQLDTVLYEDNDINDGDDMMVKAEKKENITLSLDSNRVAYRVPLDIWVKYDAGVGRVEGTGAVAVELETGYEILPDWTLKTKTELKSYEWLEKPRLKMGIVSLPVGMVADMLVNNFKSTITDNIDQQISQNLGLDTLVAGAWKKMHEPMLVSEEYKAWLQLHPQKISMSPVKINQDELQANILIESRPNITLGQPPAKSAVVALPPFAYTPLAGDDFMIRVGTEITYQEAERIARGAVEGERYDYGNRYVVVEDIELYGQGNSLVVNTKISGTYNGNIYMTGRPQFNARNNSIDVKDLKYTVDTRNFLLKSAGWLLKSKFKNMIESNLDFLLETNMEEIKQQIREQLTDYRLTDDFVLNGDLSELNIANAYMAPSGMRVDVALKGKLKVSMVGEK